MTPSYSSAVSKLIQQIEKLRNHLQRFSKNDLLHSFYTKQSLQKRYTRCLQKLAMLTKPALKAGATLGFAAILHSSSIAQKQPCDTFYKAINSNPLTRVPLPYKGLSKPAFVDIDGDGDYDCYEEYYDEKRNSHILFLRNNGTKEIPYFEEDSASGFSSITPVIDNRYNSSTDGATFIDIDNDGDYDCIMGRYYSAYTIKVLYFENIGNSIKPKFIERTGENNPFSFVDGYNELHFAFADLDNDGDYDFIQSSYLDKSYFENIGTRTKPNYKRTKTIFDDYGRHLSFYDWNKDGLVDLFQDNNYFKNVGTLQKPRFQPGTEGPVFAGDFSLIYQFADINNDGFADVFKTDGEFATTSPDASIKSDSINKILQAYPKNASFTYRWQRNGKQISGAIADHYTPKIPGLYTVEITGSCGTGVSYPYTYKTIQKTLTGEKENSFIAPQIVLNKSLPGGDIKAYPNPYTNSFVLQLKPDNDVSKTNIRITDMAGRIVEIIKRNGNNISLGSTLAKGIYTIEVLENDSAFYHQKIIKE